MCSTRRSAPQPSQPPATRALETKVWGTGTHGVLFHCLFSVMRRYTLYIVSQSGTIPCGPAPNEGLVSSALFAGRCDGRGVDLT
jgi:hypothetical protein